MSMIEKVRIAEKLFGELSLPKRTSFLAVTGP